MNTGIDELENAPASSGSPAAASEAVLCVDDDPHILNAFQSQFSRKYRLETAVGGERGLEAIEAGGRFAVVVSDLQMPGMNGIQFLSAVRLKSPDAVRVMLTGQGDLSSAIAAVNQNSVFRFLAKPCPPTVLDKVIQAGIRQYRSAAADKQLTHETLLGCVQVLVEVLSIVQPKTFSRATRLRQYVRQIASALGLEDAWQFETAALLSQIGWITLAPEIAEKALRPQTLSPEERERFLPHAAAAARILEKVAQLEVVGRIIAAQHTPYAKLISPPYSDPRDPVIAGAAMLKAVIDFDHLRREEMTRGRALAHMRAEVGMYSPEVLDALVWVQESEPTDEVKVVKLADLTANMVLDEDIVGMYGVCLLAKGQEITPTAVQRLMSFSSTLRGGTFRVRMRAPSQG